MLLLMSSQATAALTLKEFKGARDKWYTYFSAPSILTTVGKCLIPQTLHIQYHGVEEKFITECTCVTLKIKAFPAIQIKVLHETVNKQKTLPGLTKNSGIPWEINMYALSLLKKNKIMPNDKLNQWEQHRYRKDTMENAIVVTGECLHQVAARTEKAISHFLNFLRPSNSREDRWLYQQGNISCLLCSTDALMLKEIKNSDILATKPP